jgi:predicted SAM-dependent methyltransferase
MRLNLGCGSHIAEGWTNVDNALGARLAKLPFFRVLNRRIGLVRLDWDERIVIHDLRTQFPWNDETVDAIYSSHTLEHLTRSEGRHFLRECHRVLKDSGVIRIVVPDLAHFVATYTSGKRRADDFVEDLGVLPTREKGVRGLLAPFIQFPHRCMYDAPTLLAIFELMDFDAMEMEPFSSALDDIHQVESAIRLKSSIIVEARKKRASRESPHVVSAELR